MKIEKFALMFNKSPQEGINMLIESKMSTESANSIANCLILT